MTVKTATNKPNEGVARNPNNNSNPTKKVVVRVAPYAVNIGEHIAVPGRNQTLAGLENGSRITSTQKIKAIDLPGTSYNGYRTRNNFCHCKNYHFTVEGSSIVQCWDRAGTVPLAIVVPDEEAIYFNELLKSMVTADEERTVKLVDELNEWSTAMRALLAGGLISDK